MRDTFESIRRSLVLQSSSSNRGEGSEGGVINKIGRCLRKSRVGFLSKLQKSPTILTENAPPIRWRKGELIGCGAYGRVYMGMNLNSGELIAVKQVSFASRNASKEKAQAHIWELEEEVKLLKNLSHPNIVRYIGTAREDESLNIMLEFVSGGSISSLLGKFGSFPEAVIRTYTKQLLYGLEYLHLNGIIHRDIKGANILVDNRGCIKLADFGASKKVVELATISGASSMKGTPYWMAPEVILQTGHSFSADIWSVGCTVIEMATGKPPWSEQYQEVAALFHIGTTKSHPPIPDHLSLEAKDFLLKCLMKEPNLRPPASDLLQHPFVLGEYRDLQPIFRSPHLELSPTLFSASGSYQKNSSPSTTAERRTICGGLSTDCNISSMRCSNIYAEEARPILEASKSGDMCLTGINDDIKVDGTVRTVSASKPDPFSKSFNPISEPLDDWQCKFDESPEPKRKNFEDGYGSVNGASISSGTYAEGKNNFTFPCETPEDEDDDEVTELKIGAFLDEKALDLKKLQTPLYEEFYNISKVSSSPGVVGIAICEDATNASNTASRSGLSPSRVASETSASLADADKTVTSSSCSRSVLSSGRINGQILREIPLSQLNERRGLLDSQQEPNSSSVSFSERQRKWKEELDEDLQRQREMMRQAGVDRKTSSLKNRGLKRPRELFASPSK